MAAFPPVRVGGGDMDEPSGLFLTSTITFQILECFQEVKVHRQLPRVSAAKIYLHFDKNERASKEKGKVGEAGRENRELFLGQPENG